MLQYKSSHRTVITKHGWPVVGERENIPQPFMEIWHEHKSYRPQFRQEQQQDYEYRLEGLESSLP